MLLNLVDHLTVFHSNLLCFPIVMGGPFWEGGGRLDTFYADVFLLLWVDHSWGETDWTLSMLMFSYSYGWTIFFWGGGLDWTLYMLM